MLAKTARIKTCELIEHPNVSLHDATISGSPETLLEQYYSLPKQENNVKLDVAADCHGSKNCTTSS